MQFLNFNLFCNSFFISSFILSILLFLSLLKLKGLKFGFLFLFSSQFFFSSNSFNDVFLYFSIGTGLEIKFILNCKFGSCNFILLFSNKLNGFGIIILFAL